MHKLAYLFPGQGSQAVGMGKEFYTHFVQARRILEEAEDILRIRLREICFEGTEAELTLTTNAQPAILTMSIAALRVFKQFGYTPCAVAGHSMGEYAALVAAEALSFKDALRLVRLRGEWMERAVPMGRGGMVAVYGLDQTCIESICKELNGPVYIANYNSPYQIVLSGELGTLKAAEILLERAGAEKIIPLRVSGPFHTHFMKPAAEGLAEALAETTIKKPAFPFYTNVTGTRISMSDEIRQALIKQITHPIYWQKTMENMLSEEVGTFIVLGGGKALCNFLSHLDENLSVFQISHTGNLKLALENLNTRNYLKIWEGIL